MIYGESSDRLQLIILSDPEQSEFEGHSDIQVLCLAKEWS